MEEVAREWHEVWSRYKRIDYDKEVREMLASPDSREFIALLQKHVGVGKLVLEAGCGFGHKCIYFAKYHKARCVGIDIVVEPSLKILKEYLKARPELPILVVAGDVTKLPFRSNVFDVIISFGVVEHFRKADEILITMLESFRVLKPNSIFILCIPNIASTFRNKLVLTITRSRFGMYHRVLTRLWLKQALCNVGFQIVDEAFPPFGFKDLITGLVKRFHLDKAIYFLYHALWIPINVFARSSLREDYLNPICIVAKKPKEL